MKTKVEFYVVACFNYIIAAVPWALALDWITKAVTLVIAMAGFIFMFFRHRQYMKNKKLEEQINRVKLENLMQEQYQLLKRNKDLS